jgi:hypothetical protein
MSLVAALLAGRLTDPSETPISPGEKPTRPGGIVGSIGFSGMLPWTLTDEERIRLRTSPESDGRLHAVRSGSSGSSGYQESINGLQHPELFLPYELFGYLLHGLSSDAKRALNAHTLYDQGIRAAGYDVPAFWATLRTASQPYLAALESQHHLMRHTENHVIGRREWLSHSTTKSADFRTEDGRTIAAPISQELCSTRFAALEESRRRLGGANFDRFLYLVVAPHINVARRGNQSRADYAEQLTYMARGCR